jgi:hypothetical protein
LIEGEVIMISISIDNFVASYLRSNPKDNKDEVINNLKSSVAAKKSGACCGQCGQPIWAIGTAIVGWQGCFTCITGEGNDSEDYEIDQVC